jgi:hypothetical protein
VPNEKHTESDSYEWLRDARITVAATLFGLLMAAGGISSWAIYGSPWELKEHAAEKDAEIAAHLTRSDQLLDRVTARVEALDLNDAVARDQIQALQAQGSNQQQQLNALEGIGVGPTSKQKRTREAGQ